MTLRGSTGGTGRDTVEHSESGWQSAPPATRSQIAMARAEQPEVSRTRHESESRCDRPSRTVRVGLSSPARGDIMLLCDFKSRVSATPPA